jgi:hypothetical protein
MNRKEDTARLDGMAYALKRIKDEGVEAFERELKMRGRHDPAIPVSPQDLLDGSERIKNMTLDTVLTLAVAVLHDEFDFGHKRIKRFCDRYNKKIGCLADGLVSWDDYVDTIKEEIDIAIDIRLND